MITTINEFKQYIKRQALEKLNEELDAATVDNQNAELSVTAEAEANDEVIENLNVEDINLNSAV